MSVACTPGALVGVSSCFSCLTEKQLLAINTFLLCQILTNGTGGGGTVNAPVVYTNDPNTEALKPADTTKPAIAYSSSGNGAIFGWNVGSQTWV